MKVKGIFWWLFATFVFTIPLTQFFSVRILTLTAMLAIAASFRKSKLLALTKISWDIWLYLLVLLVGLAWSENVPAGLRTLETSFSLLAVPIVFNAIDLDRERLRTVSYVFVFGLLLACVICVGVATAKYIQGSDIHAFFFEALTDALQYQPTYLAYYLIFAIGFILYSLFYRESNPRAYFLGAIAIFFFFVLMLSGGRTAFISILLIFSFFILKFVLEERTPNKTLVFAVVCFMVVSLFAVNSIEYWDTRWTVESDYWERDMLWKSALRANPNPLFGVGTGDDKVELNNYYNTHGLEEFAESNFNAHNQFLQTYFANGILGVIALLIMLGRPLYLALRSGDTPGIVIIFPFFIYGMTEVFLGRYQGVVFFALLHQLLVNRFRFATAGQSLKVA